MSNFPLSLDNFTNPTGTDQMANVHAELHSDNNDAIEAIEAKIGINASDVTTSHDYKLSGVATVDKAVSKTGTETLTNKTLTNPTVNSATITGTITGTKTDNGTNTFGGANTFTYLPQSSATPTNSSDFTTKTYVDSQALPSQAGNSGKFVTTNGSSASWSSIEQFFPSMIWGDGSDGAVVISSNTTLTRDMYYSDLTVNSTFTLNTGGYRIFVSGTLTNNGTIANNGGNASGPTGGTNTKGSLDIGANAPNSPTSGGAAGAGGNIVWISAKTVAVQGIIEAKGGNASPGASAGSSYSDINGNSVNATLITSGTGGNSGGSGGTGGGIVVSKMSSKNINIMNSFFDFVLGVSLKGGASGATGEAGPGYNYGSGGGQGGVIYFRYLTIITSGTLNVSGGLKGVAYGGADDGYDGSAGLVIQYQVV